MAQRYEGKAKVVEDAPGQVGHVRITFKDDTTAGNGAKREQFAGKGRCCAEISALVFEHLMSHGVATHFVRRDGDRSFVAQRLAIVPLEVVVRNVVAGSLCKRTGLAEGTTLVRPVVEFYLKDDALGDPLLNDDHVDALKLASKDEREQLRARALGVNDELQALFGRAGLRLVDFKLEFGRAGDGRMVLADEISPDTCRLWDGRRSLDKDVFRRGQDGMMTGYREVLDRLHRVVGAAGEVA